MSNKRVFRTEPRNRQGDRMEPYQNCYCQYSIIRQEIKDGVTYAAQDDWDAEIAREKFYMHRYYTDPRHFDELHQFYAGWWIEEHCHQQWREINAAGEPFLNEGERYYSLEDLDRLIHHYFELDIIIAMASGRSNINFVRGIPLEVHKAHQERLKKLRIEKNWPVEKFCRPEDLPGYDPNWLDTMWFHIAAFCEATATGQWGRYESGELTREKKDEFGARKARVAMEGKGKEKAGEPSGQQPPQAVSDEMEL